MHMATQASFTIAICTANEVDIFIYGVIVSSDTFFVVPFRLTHCNMTAFTTVSIIVVAMLSVGNAFVSMKQTSFTRRGDLSMDGGRIPLVAGNWKMNTDLGSAVALATELAELTASVDGTKIEIAVCPPFPFLRDVKMVEYQASPTRRC